MITSFSDRFETLRAMALSEQDSRDLMNRKIDEFNHIESPNEQSASSGKKRPTGK
jgi:hypothetical protein